MLNIVNQQSIEQRSLFTNSIPSIPIDHAVPALSMQVAERSDECLVQAGTIYSLLAANKRTCRGGRLSI